MKDRKMYEIYLKESKRMKEWEREWNKDIEKKINKGQENEKGS